MKSLKLMIGIVSLLIVNGLAAVKKIRRHSRSEIVLSPEEAKFKAAQLLQKCVTKILAKREKKKIAFANALIKSDMKKLTNLLKSGVNINKQIEYHSGDTIEFYYPIFIAAIIYSDPKMVQLFLKYNANITFSGKSLVCLMLEIFLSNEGLYINPNEYFEVLNLLITDDFNRVVADSRICAFMWKIILNKISPSKDFAEEKLGRLVNDISFKLCKT